MNAHQLWPVAVLMSVITTSSGISAKLPVERPMPSLGRANAWLNSEPQTAEDLRGKVVFIDFWTYTCINWRRLVLGDLPAGRLDTQCREVNT